MNVDLKVILIVMVDIFFDCLEKLYNVLKIENEEKL